MADKKQNWTPSVNFFFQVDFMNKNKGKGIRVSFQEVSGLGWDCNINRRVSVKGSLGLSYPHLILKRPLGTLNQEFTKWLELYANCDIYSEDNVHNIVIKLLDKEGKPVAVWLCTRAYPVQYRVGDFNAIDGKILMETVELRYERLERKK